MPIQPNDPSSQAIRCQISIISAKPGSLPPAGAGFMYDMRPVSHMASTIGAVRVRASSDAVACSVTTSAMAATRSIPCPPELSWL